MTWRSDIGRMVRRLFGVVSAGMFALTVGTALGEAGTAYRVGKVVTMDDADRVINNAVVLVKDGQIESVGAQGRVTAPVITIISATSG